MHDSTRRIACHLAFIALCLAPSGSLCVWIVYRATPIHHWREHAQWTEMIYQSTGLVAEVQTIRHPTPARTLLENITLRDADGKQRIAHVRVIELARTDHGIVAIASQPEIQATQLQRLGQIFYQRVLRGLPPAQQFQLLCSELTLQSDAGAATANDVRCLVRSDKTSVQATVDFAIAGLEMQSPAQLQVIREHVDDRASTIWQLRTGGAALPCSLVSDYLDSLQAFGDRCQFQGTAWVQQDDHNWDGEFAGQFLEADLESLLAPFPHKLSGTAEITLSHTRFRQGKLVEAAGSLTCDGGVISRSLLSAAAESLKLGTRLAAEEQADTLLAYRQLAFGFQIDEAGLQLSGLCDARQEGVLLVGTSGNLLLDTQAEIIPSAALARALVPQSELQVPATSATEALLRALPLPSPTQASTSIARPPYSPIKLR